MGLRYVDSFVDDWVVGLSVGNGFSTELIVPTLQYPHSLV